MMNDPARLDATLADLALAAWPCAACGKARANHRHDGERLRCVDRAANMMSYIFTPATPSELFSFVPWVNVS